MASMNSAENRPTRRMQKSLDKLQAVEGVHEDALASALNLVNPFPDYVPKRVGWPDMKAGSSVVMVDLWETAVSQPAGVVAGETWNAHISMLPIAKKDTIQNFTITLGTWVASGSIGNIAPVNVQTWKTGTTTPDVCKGEGIAAQYEYWPILNGLQFRIVAQGLEVVNTSADLYKGGTAYGYRFETPVSQSAPYTTSAPTNATPLATIGLMDVVAKPPLDASDVDDWPNTYIGDGRDGVYVINTPCDRVNTCKWSIGKGVAFADTLGSSGMTGNSSFGCGAHTGWNIAGAFMTGLASGSSLLVKHRIYLEMFPPTRPSSSASSYIRLTNQMVPYTAVIGELLAAIMRDMPAGCAYTENPLGEWFQSILEKLEHLAPVIGSALTTIHPAAGLIGNAVGGMARGVRKIAAPSKGADSSKRK